MKRLRIKSIVGVLSLVVMFTASGLAEDANNAAGIYNRAFEAYKQPGQQLQQQINRLQPGQISPVVVRHVENNREVIELVLQAAELEKCDWGQVDLQQPVPNLQRIKDVSRLVIADAIILADKGDTKTALSRCLGVHKMARHVSKGPLMRWMMSVAMSGRADACIRDVLSSNPQDKEVLQWFGVELEKLNSTVTIFANSLDYDRKYIDQLGQGADVGESLEKKIAETKEAIKLDYAQAYKKLAESENTDGYGQIYSMAVRADASLNAIKVALLVYGIEADSGRLPDKMATDAAKDPFSGQPFGYEKTDDGFILRCKGIQLPKGKVNEFEFKVAKPVEEELSEPQVQTHEMPEEGGERKEEDVKKLIAFEDLLKLWESEQKDEFVAEFMKRNWEDPNVFADNDILTMSTADFMSMSGDERKEVQKRTVALSRTIGIMTQQVLRVGSDYVKDEDYDSAQPYFDTVVQFGIGMSRDDSMPAVKALARRIQLGGLRQLVNLYSKTRDEEKRIETRREISRLRK